MTIVDDEIDIFIDALKSLGAGAFLKEAATNMKKAVIASQNTNKTASITLKISVKNDCSGEILLFGSTNATLPKEPIRSRFYVSKNMLPVRNEPGQKLLNFGE